MTVFDVPLADNPTSGVLHFESESYGDLLPGSQIKTDDELYEILSIRENDTVTVVEHQEETVSNRTKMEIRGLLSDPSSQVWNILTREIMTVSVNGVEKSLLLYYYAAEIPEISTEDHVLVFSWILNDTVPPETDSEPDEVEFFMTFMEIHDAIDNREDIFDNLFTQVDADITEEVIMSLYIAEYNTRQQFEVHHEPTYSTELEQRLEEESASLEHLSELQNNIYV